MVEERAKAGARALSAWLKGCRATVGVAKGKSFTKLWGVLVESVLLYGAEVWGVWKASFVGRASTVACN